MRYPLVRLICCLTLWAPYKLSAQWTSADSLAITRAVAHSMLLELRSAGDHRGPVCIRAQDSLSAIWVANVLP